MPIRRPLHNLRFLRETFFSPKSVLYSSKDFNLNRCEGTGVGGALLACVRQQYSPSLTVRLPTFFAAETSDEKSNMLWFKKYKNEHHVFNARFSRPFAWPTPTGRPRWAWTWTTTPWRTSPGRGWWTSCRPRSQPCA